MANDKPTPNALAKSIDEAGIFRLIHEHDGYSIEKLGIDYKGTSVSWQYELGSIKSKKKALKELYRLSKGQVF